MLLSGSNHSDDRFTVEADVASERWGLRFTDPAIERDYAAWRLQHVRTYTRFAMWAGGLAAAGALVAIVAGAVPDASPLILALVAGSVALHLIGAWLTQVDRLVPWMLPFSAFDNLVGGVLCIVVSLPLGNFAITAGILTMAAYFGLTMFRMTPGLAFAAVGSYILAAEVIAVVQYADGDMSTSEFLIGIFIPTATLLTGMVLCLGTERATRRTYADHRIIDAQRELLFNEHSNMARFLSSELLDRIRQRGVDETLSPEVLSMTVVCTDLRGFTAFTHHHGAEAMAAVLREYYSVIVETTQLFGAMVKDFAGDGALVLVGAPVPRADHAQTGVELARGIIAALRGLLTSYSSDEMPLGIGIGVASGECAVGAIGPSSRLEYTAVGTPVNLAARLCAVAQDGEIVIADSTVRLVEASASRRPATVHVKGFQAPVPVMVEVPTVALAD